MDIKDITPDAFRCDDCSPCCPAVLETEHSYLIIGKKVDQKKMNQVKHRISEDEYVIEIDKGMIDQLGSKPVL